MNKNYLKSLKALLLAALMVLGVLAAGCNKPETKKQEINTNDLVKMCQLATMDCRYHSYIMSSAENTDIWSKLFNPDSKTSCLMEYDGVYSVGVDFKSVTVAENVATVTISAPYVLSVKISQEENPTIYIYNEDSTFKIFNNKLGLNEADELYKLAEQELKADVEGNQLNFEEALNNAKNLITAYIESIGKITETEYQIVFNIAK